jgi:hypothetical protein
MRRLVFLAASFLALNPAGDLRAHEVRPGYLQLRQTGSETFDVLWKVPARGDLRLGIYARLPESCESVSPPVRRMTGGAFTEQWAVIAPPRSPG